MKFNKKTIIAIVVPVILMGLAVVVYFVFAHSTPETNIESKEEEQPVEAPELIGDYNEAVEPESTKQHDETDDHSMTDKYIKHNEEDTMLWKNKNRDDANKPCGVERPIRNIEPGANYIEHQVLTKAETEDEALKIAEAIDGTLLSVFNGVAVIEIPITVAELMRKLDESNETGIWVQPVFIYSTFES